MTSHHEEEVLGRVYDSRLARRLVPFVRPHRRLLGASLLFLLLISAAQLAQPYVLKLVIDGPLATGDTGALPPLAVFFAVSALAEFVFRYGQMVSVELTGQKVILDLRNALYRRMQRLPAAYFDRNPVGRLVTRLTSDIENLAEVFSSGIVTLVGDSAKLIGILEIGRAHV